MIQEFDHSETYRNFQTARHKLYIAPGLSKHSRSNAVVLPKCLVDYVALHVYCCLGQILTLKIASQTFCYMNVHVPYEGHNMCV